MTFASPTHIDNLVSISTGWRKNRSVARPRLFQIAFISVYLGNNDVVRFANAGPGIAQLGKRNFRSEHLEEYSRSFPLIPRPYLIS
jgi:hypothetical protein